MDESVLQSQAQTEDLKLDVSLRPKSLTDFIGQKELLATMVGVPEAMASNGGKPKPSYKDGYTKTLANLYTIGLSSTSTNPILKILSLKGELSIL